MVCCGGGGHPCAVKCSPANCLISSINVVAMGSRGIRMGWKGKRWTLTWRRRWTWTYWRWSFSFHKSKIWNFKLGLRSIAGASDGKVLVSCIFKCKLLSVLSGTLVILVQEAKFHRDLVKIGKSWVLWVDRKITWHCLIVGGAWCQKVLDTRWHGVSIWDLG